MNKQEETYFAALSKDRSEIADVLERRAVRGYKDSVVEKYSDQALFMNYCRMQTMHVQQELDLFLRRIDLYRSLSV